MATSVVLLLGEFWLGTSAATWGESLGALQPFRPLELPQDQTVALAHEGYACTCNCVDLCCDLDTYLLVAARFTLECEP